MGLMIPNLSKVTLICVDCTDKVHLSERAIEKSLEQASFGSVKLLTDDVTRKHAVKIPKITSLEAYSKFMIRDLWKYVDTPYCLVVQWDGYIVDGNAWSDSFLRWDYLGAPFQKWKITGNGGFSLRSKKLLLATSKVAPNESGHPEDAFISFKQRNTLTNLFGIQFAPYEVASRFAFEGRSYDGKEWKGLPTVHNGQFGFHSWLSVLPDTTDRPLIFHHSGDAGDVIYSLPVIKSLGGGVLFLSTDNRHPWPANTRWAQSGGDPSWAGSLATLIDRQPYIWRTLFTHGLPFSTDVDLNKFREFYRTPRPEIWDSLFTLHCKAFGVKYPEDEPWLQIEEVRRVEGRDIIVNRTERFLNPDFPWKDLVRKYGQRMVFLGTPVEHAKFAQFGTIPRVPTSNLLEVAQVISGGKIFIGNQSCPLSIAIGLGKNHVVEAWRKNANCRFNRKSQIHWLEGPLTIPESWLE